jgi:hypothetical protein
MCAENGGGGALASIKGRTRCEKALTPHPPVSSRVPMLSHFFVSAALSSPEINAFSIPIKGINYLQDGI